MVHAQLVNTGSVLLGSLGGSGATIEGIWIVQVTAYAGLTSINPEVSVDGQNWFPASIIASNSVAPNTPVLTITANGAFYFDTGGARARLTGVGAGSAMIDAAPATLG
jgi:hypothetical protein